MPLKAFVLARHISRLSLQRERARVRVSSRCRLAHEIWEREKKNAPLKIGGCPQEERWEISFRAKILLVVMRSWHSGTFSVKQVGQGWFSCGLGGVSKIFREFEMFSDHYISSCLSRQPVFFHIEMANRIIWWVPNGPAVTNVLYHSLSLMKEAFIGQWLIITAVLVLWSSSSLNPGDFEGVARQNSFADGPGLASAVGRGGPEVCRSTRVLENVATEGWHRSLLDLWFLMLERM